MHMYVAHIVHMCMYVGNNLGIEIHVANKRTSLDNELMRIILYYKEKSSVLTTWGILN